MEEASEPEVPSEFSASAVRRAVIAGTVGHPLSVYPTVAAILGGLAVLLFGPTAPIVWGASGAAAVGLSSWLINYFFRKESFAKAYLERVHAAVATRTRESLGTLRADLEALSLEQGVEQLEQFGRKLENLKDLLGRKLDLREITYGRYLGIAEQVYLSAIDNLHEAALALRAASAIDFDYVEERLGEIRRQKLDTEESREEVKALEERKTLRAQQNERVAELLAQNESAMTQLDSAAAAIAAIRTGPGRAMMDTETAMKELAQLARRARQYSTQS